MAMSLLALPLLFAAAAAPKPPVAQLHAHASVQIVAAEEIRFDKSKSPSRQTDRQKRTREGMALVEFY